jgi:hypothetical protein
MRNKRHKHKVNSGFKGDTPPMKLQFEYDENGVVRNKFRVDQERGTGVYHPTKGWRVKREYVPHILLNDLLAKIGLKGLYTY